MRARTAVLCSVLDQAVSALTNIAVLVLVARHSEADTFALFATAYVVFSVLLGGFGAYVGQELVLHRGEAEPLGRRVAEPLGQRVAQPPGRREVQPLRQACRSAVAFTAGASAVLGALLAGGAFLTTADAAVFAALGLVLPLTLTQDTLRYCFSVLRKPQLALFADLLRLAAALPALLLQPDGASAARTTLVWGLSAAPALLLALALLRPLVTGERADVKRYFVRGHLGRRFLVEFGVGNATSQLAVLALGLFATPLAVGALRGATTLFGPLNVAFNAATGFGPPLLNRHPAPRRAALLAGGALAAVAAGWGAVLYTLPTSWGRQLLGDTWESAAKVLPATGAQYAAMAFGVCGLLALRVLAPRATMPVQLAFSPVSAGLLLAGYAWTGVAGAAWGLCLGSVLKGAAAWIQATRAPLPSKIEVSAAAATAPGAAS
ncbi:MATE family efflux transporter [Streptomyces fulvoviolaceus]|uniref:hypothetical protein n=1 Tax=Streptomyces fulvoviolaceus TaxID=285535 RepID=UPI0021C1F30F|nr:hypothetical protein [Streptomyces fulvoviolaceus]MCT9082411.1 hypothetical protein [Streptomyces fulvoviolaceus]